MFFTRPLARSVILEPPGAWNAISSRMDPVNRTTKPTPPLGRLAAASLGLEIFLGVGAIGGGLALMAGPHGEIIPLPVSALTGSPFGDYFAPGAILFAILGLGPLGAALLAWRRHLMAPFLACAVGGALLVWLVVEIAIVGYSNNPPLQPLYLGLGVVITLVGIGGVRQTRAIRAEIGAIKRT
jgi:hypothetical protein